ncbi:transposase [Arenicella chitinivorans]|uniref:Transposase n=1 Tax=Arenicella chitinivorans TaxID=1329800 RepID=A0A918VRF8_9GAMM|nr:transposase [Arenicella chitinivorans]
MTAKSYEHRRDWLEIKLRRTAEVFAIKLCSYAVMSNHYHVVLHVRPDIAEAWSEREVVERWSSLFCGTLFSQRFLAGEALSEQQWSILRRDIKCWRKRLMDISWFMRIVNESIARQANKEDRCTGRFWEGRFKSQALLDERALLSCMAYVDLNPIRAKMAISPEESDHTAINYRIKMLTEGISDCPGLEKFVGTTEHAIGIPYRLKDYLALVDWTGRCIRADKRGSIPDQLPPILRRLDFDTRAWLVLTTEFEMRFQSRVGSEHISRRIDSGDQAMKSSASRNPL